MKADAASLSNELIKARERYNAKINAILDRVRTRREVIKQSIGDLQHEDSDLAKVEREARGT